MAHRNLFCVLFVSLLVVLPTASTRSAEVSLQDIAVAMKTPAGEVIQGRTDASGRFQFPTETAGTYSLFFFPEAPAGVVNSDGAWYSLAGWPYQFSVEAPAAQRSNPVHDQDSFASKPAIRMNVVVATAAPGTVLRGSVRLAATAPQPPKYAKVKVVKKDNVKGCKGDVWISNGLGMWENNCARGQACCDLTARYDHKTRGAAQKR